MPQNPLSFLTDDDELNEAYRYSRLTPAEQINLDQRQFNRRAVRAGEGLIREAVGLPPSAGVHREAAGRELRTLAATVRPGTPEFYTQAADILQKHGLVAEAEAMQKNLHALEIGKGEMDPVMKMQRTYDELKKRFDAGDSTVGPALKALERRIAAAGTPSSIA